MKNKRLVASIVLTILLCVSLAYWALKLIRPAERPLAAPPQAKQEINIDAAAGLFGGRAAGAAVASNFQLRGVVDATHEMDSVAIIAADGKPARAVAVGSEVVPGVTVKEVHPRYVLLSENGVTKRVELPERPPPGTATTAPVGASPAQPAQRPASPPPQQPGMPAPKMMPPASQIPARPGDVNVQPAQPAQNVPAPNGSTGTNGQPAQNVQPASAQTKAGIRPRRFSTSQRPAVAQSGI